MSFYRLKRKSVDIFVSCFVYILSVMRNFRSKKMPTITVPSTSITTNTTLKPDITSTPRQYLPPSPPRSDKSDDDVEDCIPLPPLSINPKKVLDIDVGTPDAHVPRDPRLIRLTGVHPFNVEAPLSALFDSGMNLCLSLVLYPFLSFFGAVVFCFVAYAGFLLNFRLIHSRFPHASRAFLCPQSWSSARGTR